MQDIVKENVTKFLKDLVRIDVFKKQMIEVNNKLNELHFDVQNDS